MHSRHDPQNAFTGRIVSGGQTGVDRAALDAAIALGVLHGGWCPRGRLAEDGVIPDVYCLKETDSTDYPVRTERNVLDSDGTLILCRGGLSGGTKFTRRMAVRHHKPHLVVDLAASPNQASVRAWIRIHGIDVLNVAGPRESQAPGIGEQAYWFMRAILKEV